MFVGTRKVAEPYKIGERTTDLMLEILNIDKKEVVSIDGISNQEFSEVPLLLFLNSYYSLFYVNSFFASFFFPEEFYAVCKTENFMFSPAFIIECHVRKSNALAS